MGHVAEKVAGKPKTEVVSCPCLMWHLWEDDLSNQEVVVLFIEI